MDTTLDLNVPLAVLNADAALAKATRCALVSVNSTAGVDGAIGATDVLFFLLIVVWCLVFGVWVLGCQGFIARPYYLLTYAPRIYREALRKRFLSSGRVRDTVQMNSVFGLGRELAKKRHFS